jgi:pyruvate dehydrogenase E2 component (dihydrolipoamide acetyltransferase)
MEYGRVLEWSKKPGDSIQRGDIVAVIETDKATIDVESFTAGVLDKILIEPSEEWLPVGTPLAVIRSDGEAVTSQALVTAPSPPSPPSPPPPPRPLQLSHPLRKYRR